jgi:hypothetical protein
MELVEYYWLSMVITIMLISVCGCSCPAETVLQKFIYVFVSLAEADYERGLHLN